MMNTLKDFPRPLLQRILHTALTGAVCFFIGLALFIFSRDKIMLLLSGALLLCCLIRSAGLYLTVKKRKYEIAEGVCTGVSEKPLRKLRTVRIADDDGRQSTLRLGKQTKVIIGGRYRFYFSAGHERQPVISSEYLSAALLSGRLLGFETLDGPESIRK